MSSFNQRIKQIKIQNYHTPPVNEARFDNPYLLKSDTQALNDILAHLQTPLPATLAPITLPTTVTPASPTGLTPVPVTPNPQDPQNPQDQQNPQDPPFQDQDEPGDLEPMPVSGGSNEIPTVTTPHDQAPIPPNQSPPTNPQDPDMNLDETPTTPATTIIDNSPRGAGNTLQSRLAAHTAHYDGHTSLSLAGRAANPNTRVTATHPPIVPATRFTNHVGVSNSAISSLYDELPANDRNKLNSISGSTTLLNASTNPALQTLLPANFRDNKAIQQYRIRSNGNIYAYAYGSGNHPIYIGNWRESYAVTNPPFNQPTNPYDSRPRPPPTSTVLGPQP